MLRICSRCDQQLDTHGEHFTSCRPMLRKLVAPIKPMVVKPAAKPRAKPAPTVRDGSKAARIIAVLGTQPIEAKSAKEVAAAIGDDALRTGIYLCILAKDERITRVSLGRYIQRVSQPSEIAA